MKLKSLIKKVMVVSCCLTMAGAVLTGCSKSEETSTNGATGSNKETASGETKLSGRITMVGSTSMEKLALAVAEDFMNKNSDVIVSTEFVGSGAGVEAGTGGELMGESCIISVSSQSMRPRRP